MPEPDSAVLAQFIEGLALHPDPDGAIHISVADELPTILKALRSMEAAEKLAEAAIEKSRRWCECVFCSGTWHPTDQPKHDAGCAYAMYLAETGRA